MAAKIVGMTCPSLQHLIQRSRLALMAVGAFLLTDSLATWSFAQKPDSQERIGSRQVSLEALSETTKSVLTKEEAKAVNHCLAIIRNCQLPSGAIVQVRHGSEPSSPVWIAPYFSHFAAMALIASFETSQKKSDLLAVGKWLEWCAANQTPQGYWNDFEGTFSRYQSNGKVDAWDSSAALFLTVVGRFYQTGGKVSPAVLKATRKALACLESVKSDDGLTWAKPDYRVKYLMDNIEVHQGLTGVVKLLKANRLETEANKANQFADTIQGQLGGYWLDSEKQFAYVLFENGIREGGLAKTYPHGLAQLFGIASVKADRDLFEKLTVTFKPETEPFAAFGSERWAIAAEKFGGELEKEWRARVVQESLQFDPKLVYVYRPSLVVLSLLRKAP